MKCRSTSNRGKMIYIKAIVSFQFINLQMYCLSQPDKAGGDKTKQLGKSAKSIIKKETMESGNVMIMMYLLLVGTSVSLRLV